MLVLNSVNEKIFIDQHQESIESLTKLVKEREDNIKGLHETIKDLQQQEDEAIALELKDKPSQFGLLIQKLKDANDALLWNISQRAKFVAQIRFHEGRISYYLQQINNAR